MKNKNSREVVKSLKDLVEIHQGLEEDTIKEIENKVIYIEEEEREVIIKNGEPILEIPLNHYVLVELPLAPVSKVINLSTDRSGKQMLKVHPFEGCRVLSLPFEYEGVIQVGDFVFVSNDTLTSGAYIETPVNGIGYLRLHDLVSIMNK